MVEYINSFSAHILGYDLAQKYRMNPGACFAVDGWLRGLGACPGVGRRVVACLRSFATRHPDNVERTHARIDENYSLLHWRSEYGDWTNRKWMVSILLHKAKLLGWALEAPARECKERYSEVYPLWETNIRVYAGSYTRDSDQIDAPLAALMLSLNRRLKKDFEGILAREAKEGGRQDLLVETPGGHLELEALPEEPARFAQLAWANLEAELAGPDTGYKAPICTMQWATDVLRRLKGAVDGGTYYECYPRLQPRQDTVLGQYVGKYLQRILDAEQMGTT